MDGVSGVQCRAATLPSGDMDNMGVGASSSPETLGDGDEAGGAGAGRDPHSPGPARPAVPVPLQGSLLEKEACALSGTDPCDSPLDPMSPSPAHGAPGPIFSVPRY